MLDFDVASGGGVWGGTTAVPDVAGLTSRHTACSFLPLPVFRLPLPLPLPLPLWPLPLPCPICTVAVSGPGRALGRSGRWQAGAAGVEPTATETSETERDRTYRKVALLQLSSRRRRRSRKRRSRTGGDEQKADEEQEEGDEEQKRAGAVAAGAMWHLSPVSVNRVHIAQSDGVVSWLLQLLSLSVSRTDSVKSESTARPTNL